MSGTEIEEDEVVGDVDVKDAVRGPRKDRELDIGRRYHSRSVRRRCSVYFERLFYPGRTNVALSQDDTARPGTGALRRSFGLTST